MLLYKSKYKGEHMVNRVSSYFPKGGHSDIETELNNMNTCKVKHHLNYDTKNRQQRITTVSDFEALLICSNEQV